MLTDYRIPARACPEPTVLHPGVVQRDPRLTNSAKLVYRKLHDMARRFEQVFPSVAYLARECGVCHRTASSAIALLRDHGLLRTRKRGFRSTLTYWLVRVARSAFERAVANSAALARRFGKPNSFGGFKSFGERVRENCTAKKRLLREQARMLLAQEALNTA